MRIKFTYGRIMQSICQQNKPVAPSRYPCQADALTTIEKENSMRTRLFLPFAAACGLLMASSGCKSGTGKAVIRGAAQGATHGAITKNVDGPVAEGAAHGAVAAGANSARKNRAERQAEKTSGDEKK